MWCGFVGEENFLARNRLARKWQTNPILVMILGRARPLIYKLVFSLCALLYLQVRVPVYVVSPCNHYIYDPPQECWQSSVSTESKTSLKQSSQSNSRTTRASLFLNLLFYLFHLCLVVECVHQGLEHEQFSAVKIARLFVNSHLLQIPWNSKIYLVL